MSLDGVLDVIAAVCLISGASLALFAGIGLLRLPDVPTRMHAATKPQVLGLLLLVIGAGIRLRTSVDLWMLVLVVVFQLITAPVSAHMVGRAVYRGRRVRRDLLVHDDLSDRYGVTESDGKDGPPT